MQDKRISIRAHLMGVKAKISPDGKTWTEVSAVDISDGGIGFTSDAEYHRGETLKIQTEISDFLRTMEIDCDIKVIFVGNKGDGYTYGCKFMHMGKAEHTALSIFIELMVTKHPSLLIE